MRILIAGAGVTGRRLASQLSKGRHDVTVVDLNRELCEVASSQLGITAICGNATDVAVLEEAELPRADVAVALMRESADNLAFSLLAHSAGAGRIIARMTNPKYKAAFELAGVTTIVDVAGLYLDQMVLEIEHPQVQQVASIVGGQGLIVFVTVEEGSFAAGRALDELRADRRFPVGCIVAGLHRSDSEKLIYPTGRDRILRGDRLLLVGSIEGLTRAADLVGSRSSLLNLFRTVKEKKQVEEIHARIDAMLEPGESEPQDESSES
ncbi:TrkA family potassium uptake protein [Candidatus Bipolaricaulota bacterium]|nr:TrkA family potassium uptake protein [Candidatus Bipolaricaulota bacterium]